MEQIPFNRPYLVGTETGYIETAVATGWLSAGGEFTARCERWLRDQTGAAAAMLTHSCTTALEGAALMAGVGRGDEIIMPSFTMSSTATAFALRGATPVFVDIEPDSLTLDPQKVAAAITPATRAIVPVHYAGVACNMDVLMRIAEEHGLTVIEDAAQGLMASHNGRALGSIGQFGALSFHETKNVTSGEGGALLVNDPDLVERAEIAWDKGTDRRRFNRGEVDRYTWVDLGSSYGSGEVIAAFLWGQLECAAEITERRQSIWSTYHRAFASLEADGLARRPVLRPGGIHNAHMYYLLLADVAARSRFIEEMAARGILTVFHYVPLHSSPAGQRIGRTDGALPVTDELSSRLVRLPLWPGMSEGEVERVVIATREAATLAAALGSTRSRPTP